MGTKAKQKTPVKAPILLHLQAVEKIRVYNLYIIIVYKLYAALLPALHCGIRLYILEPGRASQYIK